MSLKLFSSHYNYGEALVAFSALEAGGYHPVFGNIHYCTMSFMEMEALGGVQILLPQHEHNDAKTWMTYIVKHPIKDFDPLPYRPYGRWFQVSTASFLAGFALLPLLFLPPLVLALLCGGTILLAAALKYGGWYLRLLRL